MLTDKIKLHNTFIDVLKKRKIFALLGIPKYILKYKK